MTALQTYCIDERHMEQIAALTKERDEARAQLAKAFDYEAWDSGLFVLKHGADVKRMATALAAADGLAEAVESMKRRGKVSYWASVSFALAAYREARK